MCASDIKLRQTRPALETQERGCGREGGKQESGGRQLSTRPSSALGTENVSLLLCVSVHFSFIQILLERPVCAGGCPGHLGAHPVIT